jgi:hypothetical protein
VKHPCSKLGHSKYEDINPLSECVEGLLKRMKGIEGQDMETTSPLNMSGLFYWFALNYVFFLILIVGGGVQLGPLGTAAADWPIVACPG